MEGPHGARSQHVEGEKALDLDDTWINVHMGHADVGPTWEPLG